VDARVGLDGTGAPSIECERGAAVSTTSTTGVQVRSLSEVDLGGIVRIAEKTRGRYEPDLWEDRVAYYLRRAPEGSVVAEVDGEVVGFMLGDIRSGEFGIEEKSGWIEVLGVDPAVAGRGVGRALGDEMLARYRKAGVDVVRTMVDRSMPEVEAFFVRLGFEPDGLRPYSRKL
jgi:ribosomal protein S18 acetylase RimI-like enzyme